MKFFLLYVSLFGTFFSFLPPYAPVEWQQEAIHDFGDLEQGKEVATVFTFKNTGADSLYIDNVRTACGCTSPEWEDVSVAPGEMGVITIIYDAEDEGYFDKWIKVYFNGYRKAEKLRIEGYVE
ncbi:MAG: DUF1573 domain-containing protein [Bacteroidota bacterium]